jgi:hypothetical protein
MSDFRREKRLNPTLEYVLFGQTGAPHPHGLRGTGFLVSPSACR